MKATASVKPRESSIGGGSCHGDRHPPSTLENEGLCSGRTPSDVKQEVIEVR